MRNHRRHPRLESLERRELLSTSRLIRVELVDQPETADPDDRVLEISGTARPDKIVVRQTAERIYLDGVAGSVRNLAGIALVRVDAGGGRDLVNLGGYGTRDPVTIPAQIDGGGGDDAIFGSTAADDLRGGPGLDQVYGAAGNDTVDGGDGVDFLYGGLGDDLIIGREGYDVIGESEGNDTVSTERPAAAAVPFQTAGSAMNLAATDWAGSPSPDSFSFSRRGRPRR